MTDLTPTSSFDNVRQLETTDIALAGVGGVMNEQAQSLLNRTEFLDNKIDQNLADLINESASLQVTASGIAPTDKRTLGNWFGAFRSFTGSSILGFIQSGASAVGRYVQDKLAEKVSVLDFMSDAQRADSLLEFPVLDHAPAIQAAIDSVSSGIASGIRGRAVLFPGNRNYRIGTSVTLRAATALVGEFSGQPDNYAANEPAKPSTILYASGATISGTIGGNIRGLVLRKEGLSIPQTAAQAAAWTGTAVTLGGNGFSIENCLILGFSSGVVAANHSRLKLRGVLFDCINPVDNSGSFDILSMERCEAWPYLSIGGATSDFIRTGSAYKVHDVADWAKLTDCFSYGYFRGFDLSNVNDVSLLNCSADNVVGHTGSRGFSITGNCIGIRLIAPQAAAQETGIYTDASGTANNISIVNPNLWNNTNEGIRFNGSATFSVIGGHIRGSGNGIVLNNASLSGNITGTRFGSTITSDCVNYQTATDNVRLEFVTLESGGTGRIETSTKTIPQISSAATLILNQWFDVQTVNGTTGITTISGALSKVGRTVTLHFSAALTITNSANIVLRGGVNATTAAGNIIQFVHAGGGTWREVSRNF